MTMRAYFLTFINVSEKKNQLTQKRLDCNWKL